MIGSAMAWRLGGGAALLLAMAGCPADTDGVGDGGSGSSDSGSTGNASDPGATSVVSGQSSATTTGFTTGVDSSGGGMESAGFITAGSTDEGPVGELPNGDFCEFDGDCQSGHCFQIPMIGGVCSECTSDADCENGSCQPDFGAGYAVCTDGSLGQDCMTDDGCAEGLVCAEVVGGGGFPVNRCSECSPDDPCPMGQGCVLNTDNGFLEAYYACVDDGTVPNGETCPVVGGVGDGAVCASGECAVISVFMGMFEIGVCSDCDEDMDCPMGMTCQPPDFGMGGLVPGMCI